MTLNKNHTPSSKYEKLTKITAAAMLGGIALTACGEKTTPDAPNAAVKTSTSEAAPKQKDTAPKAKEAAASHDSGKTIIPEPLKPDVLSTYTPEQITKAFEITDKDISKPADFAKAFVERTTALYMAGCDTQEVMSYKNQGKNVYETHVADKYVSAATQGLFNSPAEPDTKWYQKKLLVSNRCNVIALTNDAGIKIPEAYSYHEDLIPETVVTSGDKSNFNISFTAVERDNAPTQIMKDQMGIDMEKNDTRNAWTFTNVHLEDGKYVFTATNSAA